jgi:hypothetical protein
MATSTARLMLLLAAMLGTSVALAAQRTYDKTLPAPPGGQLTFDTVVGSVAVVGHDAPEVVVHAELQGSESFLNQIRISAEQTPSGVAVSAHGTSNGWLGWFHWSSSGNRVRFTIEVPRNYPVDLRTAGGSAQASDLNASVHARTSGGGASVQNISGAINLSTSGGGIRVEHLAGPADLSSSGGGVDVTDSVGNLDVSTDGGGVSLVNDDGKIDARTSGGSARAELQANRGISLHTSGGGITLRLPQDAHASIDAVSDGGGITFDFPLSTTEIHGNGHLAGTIGGGGPPISLRSSGGGIHVAPDK